MRATSHRAKNRKIADLKRQLEQRDYDRRVAEAGVLEANRKLLNLRRLSQGKDRPLSMTCVALTKVVLLRGDGSEADYYRKVTELYDDEGKLPRIRFGFEIARQVVRAISERCRAANADLPRAKHDRDADVGAGEASQAVARRARTPPIRLGDPSIPGDRTHPGPISWLLGSRMGPDAASSAPSRPVTQGTLARAAGLFSTSAGEHRMPLLGGSETPTASVAHTRRAAYSFSRMKRYSSG